MSATIDQVQITSCTQMGLAMFADVTFPANAMNKQVFAEIGIIKNGNFQKILQDTYSLEDPDGDDRWTKSDIESPCFYANGKDVVAKAWADYMVQEESDPGQSPEFTCDCDSMPGGGGP